MKFQTLLLRIFLAGLACTPALAQPNFEGTTLLGAAGFDAELLDESILNIRQVGANTVAIDLNWTQPTLSATPQLDILDQTIEQVTPVIDAIHARGLEVLLAFACPGRHGRIQWPHRAGTVGNLVFRLWTDYGPSRDARW